MKYIKSNLIALLSVTLNYLLDNESIELGEDTFLCGKLLDGSDKVYGFVKKDGELLVITREATNGYPISDMDAVDLRYIFLLSNVGERLKVKFYPITSLSL